MSRGGAIRSENAGISSKKTCENHVRQKSKVSWATRLDPGLVDPKARPKGVTDGYQVNIPELLTSRSRVVAESLSGLCSVY